MEKAVDSILSLVLRARRESTPGVQKGVEHGAWPTEVNVGRADALLLTARFDGRTGPAPGAPQKRPDAVEAWVSLVGYRGNSCRGTLAWERKVSCKLNGFLFPVQFQWLISVKLPPAIRATGIGHPRPAFPQPTCSGAFESIQPLVLVAGLQIPALSYHDADGQGFSDCACL